MSTRWRRPIFVGCLSLVSATLCALVLYDVLARAEKFLRIESEYAYLLVPFRWFAIGTCLLALAVVGLRWRRLSEQGREATRVGLPLRGCFYMVLFAFAAASAGYAWGGFAWMRFPILSIFFSILLGRE